MKKFLKTLFLLVIILTLSLPVYALNIVELSPGYYPNTSRSRALSSAYIYVGKPDLDPTVVVNQKTLSVQQEDGTIVEVSQPIRTNIGGVPVYAGSPVVLLVEGDYSLTVLDSGEDQVYYVPSTAYEKYLVIGNYYYPDYSEADQGIAGGGETVTDILTEVGVTEKATIYFSHNSGAATTTYTFTTPTTITDNFDIIVEKGAIFSGSISLEINKPIMPEWWGVDGTADDVQINAAITAASNNQKIKCYAPTYTCTSSIALNKSCVLSLGQTTLTSTADPVIQITSDDVVIEGINNKESKLINTDTLETIIRSVGATRKGITIRDLYFEGASTVYVVQNREDEQLIHLGDDPDVGSHTDVTIENCYFTKCIHGILLQFVDDSKIINNTFNYNHVSNIHLNVWSCDRLLISGNNFYDSSAGSTNAIEVLGAADDYSSNVIISNNTIYGDYLECINLSAKKSTIVGNTIYSNGGANHQAIQLVQLDGSSQTECYENTIAHNYIHMDNTAGVACISLKDDGDNYGVKRCIISHNIIQSDAGGISTSGQEVSDNIVEGNIINGCKGAAIYFAGATQTNNIIRGNWISGAVTHGIQSNLAEAITIEDNEITGCGSYGIYLSGGSNHKINNNRVHANTDYGIIFDTAAVVSQFDGNLLYDNTGGEFYRGTCVIGGETLTGTITIETSLKSAVINSNGGAVTATLGDGIEIGQIKTIVMTDASTSSTVSITHHETFDPEVATFDAVDETGVFMWTGTEWITLFATCTFL